jgi:hypothetical protein
MIEGFLGAIVVLLVVIAALLFKIARGQPTTDKEILSQPKVKGVCSAVRRLLVGLGLGAIFGVLGAWASGTSGRTRTGPSPLACFSRQRPSEARSACS